MKRSALFLLSLSVLFASEAARAEEGRFDAQTFRPSAAPRDLVMVPKSEVIGHKSPVIGFYYDIALDPLVFLNKDTGQTVNAVAARLQLTGLAGIGFFDWFDVSLAMPFIAWQTSDNLRSVGTEGSVQTPAFGDLRLTSKVAIPYFNRKEEIKKGFGMAVTGNINLPTGSTAAFAGDGVVTGGASIITDYRFNLGVLLTGNVGIWFRPDRQFAGVRVGDMASVGLAAEAYVVQRWGLSVLGGVYGYPSLTKFPDSARQIPAEVLLALRWQTKQGITITFGGSFGAACGFGAPAIRFFNGITFQPKSSREQEEINRLLQRDSDDPDHDGLIAPADKCPNEPGRPENFGCPDTDSDGDGVVDRDDQCPDLPAGPGGRQGCPSVYVKGDEIVITDQVHFATDKDVILDESKPILEAVARVLVAHPEIRELEVEGHTDVRASAAYNLDLSQRRVDSVRTYLIEQGIDPGRITAKGYGHTQPLYDDTACDATDEELSADCRFMTSKNRRVVFRIVRRGAPPPRALSGADNNASILPSKSTVLPSNSSTLPNQGALPKNQGTLPSKGTLPSGSTLPSSGGLPSGSTLPKNNGTLPSKSVLPRSGAPAPKTPTEAKPKTPTEAKPKTPTEAKPKTPTEAKPKK